MVVLIDNGIDLRRIQNVLYTVFWPYCPGRVGITLHFILSHAGRRPMAAAVGFSRYPQTGLTSHSRAPQPPYCTGRLFVHSSVSEHSHTSVIPHISIPHFIPPFGRFSSRTWILLHPDTVNTCENDRWSQCPRHARLGSRQTQQHHSPPSVLPGVGRVCGIEVCV